MVPDGKISVVMVGAFPPPVHGMAVVNATVRQNLIQAQAGPLVINLSPSSLDRSLKARLGRLPKVLRGLVRLTITRGLRGGTLYMSVSGGFGQLYELAFVALGRLRGMRLLLHHHSFAYLDSPSRLTDILGKTAGRLAVHVTQSSGMGYRLKRAYGVSQVIPVSNAVFFLAEGEQEVEVRSRLRTLGFISNIAAEKGVFEFLDLVAAAQQAGSPVRGKLAGPFQDDDTERRVRARLANLPTVEYVGGLYGSEKDVFFGDIDALVFPTRYANETEGIVNHEAMSRGIPVIAYGRGCIPEIIGPESGLVIDPAEPFVPAALAQVEEWLTDPRAFEAASKAAAMRFSETYQKSQAPWQALLSGITGRSSTTCTARAKDASW